MRSCKKIIMLLLFYIRPLNIIKKLYSFNSINLNELGNRDRSFSIEGFSCEVGKLKNWISKSYYILKIQLTNFIVINFNIFKIWNNYYFLYFFFKW